MPTSCEVLVIGSGPAGRWVAQDLARAGVDVRIVAPKARAPLVNTFAVWTEHLAGLDVPIARRWDSVDVVFEQERRVERSYCVVDREEFVTRADAVIGERWVEGTVAEVLERAGGGRTVTLLGGNALHARLVIDASGSARVSAKAKTEGHAHQVALGEFIRTSAQPQRPMLMDYSGGDPSDALPSFGYILPVADDRLLVEETWLAVRPLRAPSSLEQALRTRRARWPCGPVEEVERVSIDLEVPLATNASLCVMLGAAGGQVHPATGYSFAAGVVSAARLAEFCIANRPKLGEESFVRKANERVVSVEQRRAHALFAYGLDGMLRMDRRTIAAFFEAFFKLSLDEQSVYLNGLSGVHDVRRVMLRLFPSLPMSVQWALVAGSPFRLARAFG